MVASPFLAAIPVRRVGNVFFGVPMLRCKSDRYWT